MEQEQPQEWIIVCLTASAITFVGTRAEAEEHRNKYAAHLETIYKENQLHYRRYNQMLVPDPRHAKDNGVIDIDAEIEKAAQEDV